MRAQRNFTKTQRTGQAPRSGQAIDRRAKYSMPVRFKLRTLLSFLEVVQINLKLQAQTGNVKPVKVLIQIEEAKFGQK